jgi:hypothetical protein
MQQTIKKSATIFFEGNRKKPRKYRSIYYTARFEAFAANSGAIYINYYNQSTKEYIGRKYLKLATG